MDTIQLSLQLNLPPKETRQLLENGEPSAGQRWRDAIKKGEFTGSFLSFLQWESRDELAEALSLGFRANADWFIAKAFGLDATQFYQKYISVLDSIQYEHTPEQLGNVIDEKPKRQWSDEAKYRVRMSRLKKRLSKKFTIPHFFDEALSLAIAAQPNYYGVNSQGNSIKNEVLNTPLNNPVSRHFFKENYLRDNSHFSNVSHLSTHWRTSIPGDNHIYVVDSVHHIYEEGNDIAKDSKFVKQRILVTIVDIES